MTCDTIISNVLLGKRVRVADVSEYDGDPPFVTGIVRRVSIQPSGVVLELHDAIAEDEPAEPPGELDVTIEGWSEIEILGTETIL